MRFTKGVELVHNPVDGGDCPLLSLELLAELGVSSQASSESAVVMALLRKVAQVHTARMGPSGANGGEKKPVPSPEKPLASASGVITFLFVGLVVAANSWRRLDAARALQLQGEIRTWALAQVGCPLIAVYSRL